MTTIALLQVDGSSVNIEAADVTGVAAMSDSECILYGVSRGTKVSVGAVDYFSALSLQEFLTQLAAAIASKAVRADTAPDFTEDANAFTDVVGLEVTIVDDGTYSIISGGLLSTSLVATGSVEARLTKNNVQLGDIMVLGVGCFIANGALERPCSLTAVSACVAGDSLKLQIRRGAGAGVAGIDLATLQALRIGT